jgi:flagellar hook-associated protein 2
VASQASVTGSGFGGTYVDDGTADTLTIRDLGTESTYSVALSNGMDLTDIVEALNSEFNSPEVHQVQASEAMYADAVGTAATDSTFLQDLYKSDGSSFGVTDGDVITLSGRRADGSSFLEEFHVTDVTAQTLGDLRSAVESAVGTSETVTWDQGKLTVTNQETGRSSLSLAVSSNNAGGGSLTFGTVGVVTEGRSAVDISASDEGGELKLAHGDYGSVEGFEVSFTAGGTDGTASLGLSTGTYQGTDVAGTIGGHSATGAGRLLMGDDDTAVEGLMFEYDGADTGSVGTMAFSRGIASGLHVETDALLGSESGSIDAVMEELDPRIERMNDRIEALEDRLERRRETLIEKFSAMEEALSRAQQQSQWLSAQFSALAGAGTVGL